MLALSAISVLGLFRLKVDQDLKALLPPDAPSITRLEELRRRMGSQSDFIVEIKSPDRNANIAFGNALAAKMSQMPEFRYVIFRRDISFFEKNALLYLPLANLVEVRRKVIDRIRSEVARNVALQLDDEAPDGGANGKAAAAGKGGAGGKGSTDGKDKADRDQLLPELDEKKLAEKVFAGAEVPGEYMEVDEGRLMVIKARPTFATTDIAFTTKLVDKVNSSIKELGPARFHPQLTSIIQGEYAARVGDVTQVSTGVYSATAFTLLVLLGVIVLYFRSVRAIIIVFVPVVVGTLITQGLGVAIYGTFNIVTTFIFAILMGLGIDYVIHCLSRYRFERQRGLEITTAIEATHRSAGSALLACALTTGSGFFLLQLAHFRGFSQFGLLAGLGLLVALAVTFIMVPALVVVLERLRPLGWHRSPPPGAEDRPAGPALAATPRHGGRVVAVIIVAISLLAAGLGLARLDRIPFEYDFSKLEPKPPAPPPGPQAPRQPDFEDAVGTLTTFAPAVAMCESAAQCEEVTRLFEAIRRLSDREMTLIREGKTATPEPSPANADEDDEDGRPLSSSLDPLDRLEAQLSGGLLLPDERARLAGIPPHRLEEMRFYLKAHLGMHSFVPSHQEQKLQIIADVRRRIDAKRGLLDDSTNRQIDKWYSKLTVNEPVTATRIPKWALRQLEQVDGALGRFAILWNGGIKVNYKDSKRLYDAFFNLPVKGGEVKVAANYFVLVEVLDTLKADGPVVLAAAAFTIFLVLLIHFRSAWSTMVVLVPLLISLVWVAGVYLIADWKLNVFSVLAFALLTGMGIDNGIHVYHRWHEQPSVRVVLREAGGPVALSTFTNFIGFAGLVFASHRGIQSLGLTASIGIWFALVASLATLPALLYLFRRRVAVSEQVAVVAGAQPPLTSAPPAFLAEDARREQGWQQTESARVEEESGL